MSSLGSPKISSGDKLGFEIGIDNGDNSGNRISQIRWSNPQVEGFHLNPSLWGLMILKRIYPYVTNFDKCKIKRSDRKIVL